MADPAGLITVSCSNHHEALTNGLWRFFQANYGVDFEIHWGGQSMSVHQLILDVFLAPEKVTAGGSPKRKPPADQRGDNCMDYLMEFMYTGKVEVRRDRVEKLNEVARLLDFQMLLSAIELATLSDKAERSLSRVWMYSNRKSSSLPIRGAPKPTENSSASKVVTATPAADSDDADNRPQMQSQEDSSEGSIWTPETEVTSKAKETAPAPVVRPTVPMLLPDVPPMTADIHGSMRLPDPAVTTPYQVPVAHMSQMAMQSLYAGMQPQMQMQFNAFAGCGQLLDLHVGHRPPPAVAANPAPVTTAPPPPRLTPGAPTRGVGGKRPYRCDLCGKVFKRSQHLNEHMFTHTKQKPYKCSECPKSYSQSGALLVHQRVHTGEKPHKCNTCGMAFTQSSSLSTHQLVHTGARPHKCDVCGLTYARREALISHHLTHTEKKRYRCEICGEEFRQRWDRNMHALTHTGVSPKVCHVCGKEFHHRKSLNAHARTHRLAGQKPFVCDACGKAFSSRLSLDLHFRTHTGEKPHKCDECGKCFARDRTLIRHQRTHSK